MRYYFIAGEASGDLHGANLLKSLCTQDPDADIRAWGGDLMQAAGATVVKHYRTLAFMGFVEVLRNICTIFRNIRLCKADIEAFQPDVLVLIDYPGFNMRIAKWAKKRGLKVVYYISPQIWAWHQSRVHTIKKTVDTMLCILPFEADFYKKYDYDVTYVGHPLLDAIPQEQPLSALRERWHKPVVALLAGSRKQEVRNLLPVMCEIATQIPDYQLVVAGAPNLEHSFYQEILDKSGAHNIDFISNQTYDLLRIAHVAVVASGTATLEVALFGVPEVVCYRGDALSVWLARRLINLRFISLVNLIMDKQIVRELIQNDCNADRLLQEVRLLFADEQRQMMKENYTALRNVLGGEGASSRAAAAVVAAAHAAKAVKNTFL